MVTYLARFRADSDIQWGVVTGAAITPLQGTYRTTGELIEHGRLDWQAARERPPVYPVESVELLSPVTTPCRVICQGANYRQHAIESGMDPDARAFNLFFDKTDASITGPHNSVVRPAHVQLLDFEIELALVIGSSIEKPTTVTDENLDKHVFAITIANDLSARDVQLPQGQYFKGKSYRGFCPLGPFLAVPGLADWSLLDNLDLRLEVNGQLRQYDNTSNMLYRPAETLTELTEFCNLRPGDVLLTGTPHGCTATTPPPLLRRLATALLPEDRLWELFIRQNRRKPYLAPGDVVTASIRNSSGSIDLGTQRTTITAPRTHGERNGI
ncbi:fumarylacetoacetate hydrolase family protein [Nocardia abscessus]|uniref:fumarylacetoacetate hydrolase family protein n=1 Tax=Nocardia abscessus TaxID=120957 RepID=UPI001894B168|nr:fumarylacetoacetate hydrolase family protein [Nocardia abscessus]MBF6341095.1 fumarylacetoacetate hydrolase family protein [Nocardia abscessus]